jgi:hypothetical protein
MVAPIADLCRGAGTEFIFVLFQRCPIRKNQRGLFWP